jgi:hypothetical protein
VDENDRLALPFIQEGNLDRSGLKALHHVKSHIPVARAAGAA